MKQGKGLGAKEEAAGMLWHREPGWKWDTVIYDRPGWNSFTYGYPAWGAIKKRKGEILVRFDSADEQGINDDFYFEHYRQVVLSSANGGLSWKEIQPDWKYSIPLELSDGTLVEVIEEKRTIPREEQKARLQRLGIGQIWRDDCLLAWELWPEEMAGKLRAEGLFVWNQKVREGSDWRYLPDGVVATYASSDLLARRSSDAGSSWKETRIPSRELFAHFVLCFAGSAVLPDDTVLIPCYGAKRNPDAAAGKEEFPESLGEINIYIMRSEDRGETYQLQQIPATDSARERLNETCLTIHPSGRAVALSRNDVPGSAIHCTISEDGGRNWRVPRKTGLRGSPLSAICLASGNLLCTYARRSQPAGIRGCLSRDGGETWDVAEEKIIRDDVLPACFLGGPGSVQLDDGTIFTFYSLPRFAGPKKGDVIDQEKFILDRSFHQYIAGSRYTEDFRCALGTQ